jgi:hypothetical protein
LVPQSFDCSFYLLPENTELTIYDTENNPITQINYAGDNINQSIYGHFNAIGFNGKQLNVDNLPPSNPTTCSDFGTTGSSCTNDDDPYFVWSGASDNYSNVQELEYYYYWGTDPSGLSETNIATYNGYDPDPLVENGMYYLRINTVDEAGNSS